MKNSLAGLSVLLGLTMAAAPSQARAGHGNEVTRWNEEALASVRDARAGAAGAARTYAMVNAAMYDAVNGIDRRGWGRDRAHALIPPHGAPIGASRRAAAAAAAHAVLSALYPSRSSIYDAALAADLGAIRGHYRRARGRSWGAYVGAAVVAARAADGAAVQDIQPGGTGPGEFRNDFTSAQYRNMTPFAVQDASAYDSAGAPALTSREYASAFEEVRLWGDGRYANPEYDEIYRFWRGGGGSARPPGEWIKIAIVVAESEGTTRSISDSARLFALLGMALGDATITAWRSKYAAHLWRPTTAVREADTDGNPETTADPAWVPRNGSAGSSPEHTSGQSTYAGAGSTILAAFYCTDNVGFTFTGDDSIAGPRSFASFSDAAREAGRARIMAGIHFEFSNQAGQAAGRGIAREIAASALRPIRRNAPSDCPR